METLFKILILQMVLLFCLFDSNASPATAAGDIHRTVAQGDSLIANRQYADAISYYKQVMERYERGERDSIMPRAFVYGGNACLLSQRYIDALEFYVIGMDAATKLNCPESYESCVNNVGYIYVIFDDYENGIYYFGKSLKLAQQHDNNQVKCIASTNLVTIYSKIGRTKEAKVYYRYQQQNSFEDPAINQFYLLTNKAHIEASEQSYRSAIELLKKSLDLVDTNHNLSAEAAISSYEDLTDLYLLNNQLDSAIVYGLKTQDLAIRTLNPVKERSAYYMLSQVYDKLGSRDSADVYRLRYMALSDSLFNRQEFNRAKSKLLDYEERVTNEHIYSLKSIIRNQVWALVAISTLLLATGLILFIIYRYNRKLRNTQRILVDKNQELIQENDESHKLRTDLLQALDALKQSQQQAGATEPNTVEASGETADVEAACSDDVSSKARVLMSETRRTQLLKDINEVMGDVNTISNSDFNLNELAKMVNSNTKYVAAVIHDNYNKNFKNYLSECRIREASKRLIDSTHYGNLTIAAIAETVGYSSPTSFVEAFKRVMGMTPSVYKRLSQQSQGDASQEA